MTLKFQQVLFAISCYTFIKEKFLQQFVMSDKNLFNNFMLKAKQFN